MSGNNRNRRECFLNETAASLLMTYSKNTPKAREFKIKLILAYDKLKNLKVSMLEEHVTELELIVREVVSSINVITPKVDLMGENIVSIADVVNKNSFTLNNNVSETNQLKILVKKKK